MEPCAVYQSDSQATYSYGVMERSAALRLIVDLARQTVAEFEAEGWPCLINRAEGQPGTKYLASLRIFSDWHDMQMFWVERAENHESL